MSRLRPSFLLILIASASLLSAVSDGGAATPSNQPHTNQGEHTASHQHTAATAKAVASNQPGSRPTSSESANYTHNYYYPAPESWLTFFGQIATIVSAVLLTLFTGGLWLTSIWQWKAINRQAQIAQDALEISQRAYLSIENVEYWNLGPEAPCFTFDICNTGHRPATGVEEGFMILIGAFIERGQQTEPKTMPTPKRDAGVIAPGKTIRRTIGRSEAKIFIDLFMQKRQAKQEPLPYAQIAVSYYDGFGKQRTCGRVIRYDTRTNDFGSFEGHQN